MAAQGKTSKTTRSSTPAGKAGSFEMSPDIARLIPVGDGKYCYVRTPSGATTHTKVGSDAFFDAVRSLAGGPAAKRTAVLAAGYGHTYRVEGWAEAAAILDEA